MLRIDNTTAVAHINQMGGTHSELCNAVTRDMLLWCKARGIWLSAVFIPGKYNVKADWESRHFSDNTEWKLSRDNFELVLEILPVRPTVYLFASRLNHHRPSQLMRSPTLGKLYCIHFPSILLNLHSSPETGGRWSRSHGGSSALAHSSVVFFVNATLCITSCLFTQESQNTDDAARSRSCSFSAQDFAADCMPIAKQ